MRCLVWGLVGAWMCGAAVAGAEEWKPLFNGENLDGWIHRNGTASYWVEDGAIVGRTDQQSPNSFLCTAENYGDFELEFEVKLDPRLNSGVQIRSNSDHTYRNGRVHGYQVEISTDGMAGYIYDEGRRGWLSEDRKNQGVFKIDDWNHYRIRCQGDHMQTWVNGTPVADLHDAMTPAGFIGLQVHSFGGTTPAEVRWRNIKLKQLNSEETAAE